jgi:hypothetical protein
MSGKIKKYQLVTFVNAIRNPNSEWNTLAAESLETFYIVI